jgi:hypothetical protein
MKNKAYSYKYIVLIGFGVIVGCTVIFWSIFSAGDKSAAAPNCYFVGAFDVDSYELHFSPEMIDGCEHHIPPEMARPLESLRFSVYMPESYTSNKVDVVVPMKSTFWPIGKKKFNEDVEITIFISYRRIVNSFDQNMKMYLSRSRLVESDVEGFEKYQEDKHQSYYVNKIDGYIVSCFDLYGEGGRCKLEYNIMENNNSKGLVRYSFDRVHLNKFYSINSYVRTIIGFMVKEKSTAMQ